MTFTEVKPEQLILESGELITMDRFDSDKLKRFGLGEEGNILVEYKDGTREKIIGGGEVYFILRSEILMELEKEYKAVCAMRSPEWLKIIDEYKARKAQAATADQCSKLD